MPLMSKAEAMKRKQKKTLRVLRFLRLTTYSTAEILGQVMQVSDRATILKTLKRMEAESLLSHNSIEIGSRLTLWGITATGQQTVLQHGEDLDPRTFNMSKVSRVHLMHYLGMQRIHVFAENSGWKDFIYCDRVSRFSKQKQNSKFSVRPDLVAVDPNGHKAAIEYERNIKSIKNYYELVIPGHIVNINSSEYDYVLWICNTPNEQRTLLDAIGYAVKMLKEANRWNIARTSNDYDPLQISDLQTFTSHAEGRQL